MSSTIGAQVSSHIKSRQRVRDLAEVYTHEVEVNEMLDLVSEMFPSHEDPGNTDRKFLEPACGSGNFLEDILRRKLAFVTTRRYGMGERYEHRVLRALASIYAIDIDMENVNEARARLHAIIASKVNYEMTTKSVSEHFFAAVDAILSANIIRADALHDAESIRFIHYQAGKAGTFLREWSPMLEREDLFQAFEVDRDGRPVHYSELHIELGPVAHRGDVKDD